LERLPFLALDPHIRAHNLLPAALHFRASGERGSLVGGCDPGCRVAYCLGGHLWRRFRLPWGGHFGRGLLSRCGGFFGFFHQAGRTFDNFFRLNFLVLHIAFDRPLVGGLEIALRVDGRDFSIIAYRLCEGYLQCAPTTERNLVALAHLETWDEGIPRILVCQLSLDDPAGFLAELIPAELAKLFQHVVADFALDHVCIFAQGFRALL